MNFTPGADIDRLRAELDEYAQEKQFRQFVSMPNKNQLKNGEAGIVNDGTTISLIFRVGDEIKSVTLT